MTERTFLTLAQQVQLADWLKHLPMTEPRTRESLAEEAAKELKASISPSHIRRISQELDIPLPPSVRGSSEKAKLSALEARVVLLEKELQILKAFYINTTKEPRGNGSN